MSQLIFGRGYVYSINYHFVFCTKYRQNVLINDVDLYLKELLYQLSIENNITIVEMETDKDHVHLLVSCSPQHYIPNIVKSLKGTSARMIFKKFPELKSKLWKGHLWNPSYFVSTVSESTEIQIREYIKHQKKK